jgi:ferritin-like metal-binding protein YciE
LEDDTIIAFAKELGQAKHASLLAKTLEEEKATDEKLSELATDVNAQANQSDTNSEDGKAPTTNKKTRVD